MTLAVHLDHLLVPARDRFAAARQLAELLGVAWGPSPFGPFTAVYVDDGLTIDFDEWSEAFAPQHLCFRFGEAGFDAFLARLRAAGVAYRSTPHGLVDHAVNMHGGGRLVYWDVPDGHVWEALTVSYARRPE
jgi:catechol 2,3-dioxygenase-like lactoylglutathione lyase family enzyme